MKKSGKTSELIPCPFCRKGKAVNNSKAWAQSQANKYVRQRKDNAKIKTKRLPIVVHNIDLEASLVNPDWLQRIQPPSAPKPRTSFDNFLDSRFATIIMYAVGIVLVFLMVSWLEELGFDSDEAIDKTEVLLSFALLAGFYGWYFIERRRETSDEQDYKTQLQNYRKTWICLRCNKQFLPDHLPPRI